MNEKFLVPYLDDNMKCLYTHQCVRIYNFPFNETNMFFSFLIGITWKYVKIKKRERKLFADIPYQK